MLRHPSRPVFRRGQSFASGLLILLLVLPAPPGFAAEQKPLGRQRQASTAWKGRLPIKELSEQEAIVHALNRLAFGPRPGDVERLRRMGLETWIEQQLHPETVDDSAMTARLQRYPTLAMSSTELLEEYPPPQLAARRADLTPEEFRRQQAQRPQKRRQDSMGETESGTDAGDGAGDVRGLRNRRQGGFVGAEPLLRQETSRRPARIVAELSSAKMLRAIYSERQLEEVMADFWYNHFNVFAGKGADRWLLTSYERDVIRPRALGNFHDLLLATAKSPAMLFYLDNWQSVDPEAFDRLQQEMLQRRQRFQGLFGMLGRRRMQQLPGAGQADAEGNAPLQQRRRGLNENYARELMELHTLGVEGGYTQRDVVEVARAFTGWTLQAPRRNPEFLFNARLHDPNPKTVLGKKIHAGGIRDGEEVLRMLAQHPSTGRFLSTKLARRFVADEPPPALVQRMADTFRKTNGDIRAVLRAMIYSAEFWSRQSYRAKIKKPFELVASTARAVGAEVREPLPLVFWAARIGEPLYQCQPPTGYSDKAEAWVNTGALLNRMNFALALAGSRTPGTRADLPALFGPEAGEASQQALTRFLDIFLAGQVSPETRSTLERKLREHESEPAAVPGTIPMGNIGLIAGLVLGSPEFQRR